MDSIDDPSRLTQARATDGDGDDERVKDDSSRVQGETENKGRSEKNQVNSGSLGIGFALVAEGFDDDDEDVVDLEGDTNKKKAIEGPKEEDPMQYLFIHDRLQPRNDLKSDELNETRDEENDCDYDETEASNDDDDNSDEVPMTTSEYNILQQLLMVQQEGQVHDTMYNVSGNDNDDERPLETNEEEEDNDDDNDNEEEDGEEESQLHYSQQLDDTQQATLDLLLRMQQGDDVDSHDSTTDGDDDAEQTDEDIVIVDQLGTGELSHNNQNTPTERENHCNEDGDTSRSGSEGGEMGDIRRAIANSRVTRKGRRLAEQNGTDEARHVGRIQTQGEEPQPGAVEEAGRPYGLTSSVWNRRMHGVRERTSRARDQAQDIQEQVEQELRRQREERISWKLVEGLSSFMRHVRLRPVVEGELLHGPENLDEQNPIDKRDRRCRSLVEIGVVALAIIVAVVAIVAVHLRRNSRKATNPVVGGPVADDPVPTQAPTLAPTNSPTEAPTDASAAPTYDDSLLIWWTYRFTNTNRNLYSYQFGGSVAQRGPWLAIGAPGTTDGQVEILGGTTDNTVLPIRGNLRNDFAQIGRSVSLTSSPYGFELLAIAGKRAVRVYALDSGGWQFGPELKGSELFNTTVSAGWTVEGVSISSRREELLLAVTVQIQGNQAPHHIIMFQMITSENTAGNWIPRGQPVLYENSTNVNVRVSGDFVAIAAQTVQPHDHSFTVLKYNTSVQDWTNHYQANGSFTSLDMSSVNADNTSTLVMTDTDGLVHFMTVSEDSSTKAGTSLVSLQFDDVHAMAAAITPDGQRAVMAGYVAKNSTGFAGMYEVMEEGFRPYINISIEVESVDERVRISTIGNHTAVAFPDREIDLGTGLVDILSLY